MSRLGRLASRWTSLVTAVVATGCGELPPVGQVRLHVDTDAVVPATSGGQGASDVPPLFDTLIVDVYEPDATSPCAGCSRTFVVDEEGFVADAISFGIPAEPEVEGYVARLRLYEAAATIEGDAPPVIDGAPPPSVIDAWVSLPVVGQEGIVQARVVLQTEDVGMPIGSREDPVSADDMIGAASIVGTWPGARRVACSGSAGPNEVCVPGGAFWMGNPRALGLGIGDEWDQRRLVRLDPFYLDENEVTVAEWRQFDPTGVAVKPFSGEVDGFDFEDFCTFTATPGPKDDHPIVCLRVEDARAYCQAQGKDLPTEAQLEYVASGLEGQLFVWGADEPACEDAVLQRYGEGIFDDFELMGCYPPVPPGGAEPVGGMLAQPRRDRLVLETGTIYDIVGNVSEWVLDRWNRQGESCWSSGGVYQNPICLEESIADGPNPVFRMGSYAVGPRQAIAAARSFISSDSAVMGNGIDLGFRCARPGN